MARDRDDIYQRADENFGFLSEGEALILALLFCGAGALILLGLFLPALHVDRLWFFTRDISLVEGIRDLADEGQGALAWLLFLLSVCLPVGKALIGLFVASFVRVPGSALRAFIGLFDFIGKWSLADVFVLAILVMIIDGQVIDGANVGIGVYCFAFGVILSWIATAWLRRAAKRALG